MENLPFLVKRCLTHGVRIYPYELSVVLEQYKNKPVPDEILHDWDELKLLKYVKALYYSGQEGAGYWTKGHDLLIELGFHKTERQVEPRLFVSVAWPKEEGE